MSAAVELTGGPLRRMMASDSLEDMNKDTPKQQKMRYVTTTLPYVNAEPHVGFAMELVRADAYVRYWRQKGYQVFFNTGTDEHGMKIYQNAQAAGVTTQEFVDRNADAFKKLIPALNISEEITFTRTTDPRHKAAAQRFWQIVAAKGDIYKKEYTINYCVGCELEKTESELVDGKCPLHPHLEIQHIHEENYFFRFSKYADRLLALYKERPDFVIPSFRFNEVEAFVSRGLEDFSISRLASKMPWGIPVPGDSEHVMYVWFDALINYVSAIGWPDDMDTFNGYWPVIQFAGKDNLRQQSAMWQAMLMAADLPPSKQIIINGFITGAGGIKMSKSLGNVISPMTIVEKYGAEALRSYLIGELQPFEDSPFTMELFETSYVARLSHGIGNTVSRILKMAALYDAWPTGEDVVRVHGNNSRQFSERLQNIEKAMIKADMQAAFTIVRRDIESLDKLIQSSKPFELHKTDAGQARTVVAELVVLLRECAIVLKPFLPETAEKILTAIEKRQAPPNLFPPVEVKNAP